MQVIIQSHLLILHQTVGSTVYSYDPADTSLIALFDNDINGFNGDIYDDTTDEVFTESLDGDTYYYIVIDEWDNAPSSYTLQIVQ